MNLDKVKKHLNTQADLAYGCSRYLFYYEYLALNEDPAKTFVTGQFDLLSQAANTFYERAIIDLCKLFDHNPNQHYNIFSLLDKLDRSGYLPPLEADDYKKKIKNLLTQSQKDINTLIPDPNEQAENVDPNMTLEKTLLHQRDKFFAHTDEDRNVNKSHAYLKAIKELVKLLLEIIENLRFKLLETESRINKDLKRSFKENDLLDFLSQYVNPEQKNSFKEITTRPPIKQKRVCKPCLVFNPITGFINLYRYNPAHCYPIPPGS